MREIKFRAWDKLRKQMLDVYEISFDSEQIAGFCEAEKKTYRLNPLDDDFDLMQFTGLHDAKGVEIYEGDVVVYAQNNLPVAVIFSNGGFSVDLRGPNHSGESFLGTMLSQDIEVIGNVYENAELLK